MQNVICKTFSIHNRLKYCIIVYYSEQQKKFRATNQQQKCKNTVFSVDFRSKYNAFRCAYQMKGEKQK